MAVSTKGIPSSDPELMSNLGSLRRPRQVEFQWRPKASGDSFVPLKCLVDIPNESDLGELAFRLMKCHNLPFYVKGELHEDLVDFIRTKTSDHFSEKAGKDLERYSLTGHVGELAGSSEIGNIAALYKREYKEFSDFCGEDGQEKISSDSKIAPDFSQLYHSLLHSGDQLQVIRIEDGFSSRALFLRSEMKREFDSMIEKQNRELEASHDFSEHLLNRLALVQVEERQAFDAKWKQKNRELQESQRRMMHEWMINASGGKFELTNSEIFTDCDQGSETATENASHPMAESFTIHLGSQLKLMHNLRLTSVDLMDFCRKRSPEETLQTSMWLYSTNLHGVVILVDNRVSSYRAIKKEFAEKCESRCELHFAGIEEQLSEIRRQVRELSHDDSDKTKSFLDNDEVSLKVGDVYVTRHSNLSGAHAVFHLVAGSEEDELLGNEISSRHQVILGLRNILRIAHERDVRTLSIPLLLANTIGDEISSVWSTRRAELVYKCVKGFMIEMAALVADAALHNPRTVEFLIPPNLDEKIFISLSAMLQNIFKMSNPLVLKSSGSIKQC